MNIQRIKKLQASLEQPLLIKKKENLLYLTGRSFMHGYLLVKPFGRHSEAKGRRIPRSFAGAQDDAVVFFGDGLEKVEGIKIFDRLKNIPLYLSKAARLQLEDQFMFAESNYIRQKIKDAKLKVKVEHQRSPVDFQRQIKDQAEISNVRKSMQIVGQVFGQVKNQLRRSAGHRPAWTEIRLAEFIKSVGLKLGAEDISFPPIVASGANAAIPHHVPSSKRLKAGESIIIDFGFKYKNYCSDFTRTVFLHHAPKKLAEAYNQTEKAYNACIHQLQPSRPPKADTPPCKGGELYDLAVDVLAEKHLDKYFIHSLGHGTGLEIHELPNLSPNSKDILQNGMVFSIEPGVYIPKLGGIRIEDLVYLKGSKVEKFINVSTKLKDNII